MKYYYHATSFDNLGSILCNGISPGPDGLVYMCDNPKDSLKFLYIRRIRQILVCKIKILKQDESNIIETFDHSKAFFKCRAFGYKGVITTDKIADYIKYEL